jgi:hypothetical protein
MSRYIITYVQECTQPITRDSIGDAADYAKRYAHANGLKLLSVYLEQSPANPQLPAPDVA